jgi:hypothetical protein
MQRAIEEEQNKIVLLWFHPEVKRCACKIVWRNYFRAPYNGRIAIYVTCLIFYEFAMELLEERFETAPTPEQRIAQDLADQQRQQTEREQRSRQNKRIDELIAGIEKTKEAEKAGEEIPLPDAIELQPTTKEESVEIAKGKATDAAVATVGAAFVFAASEVCVAALGGIGGLVLGTLVDALTGSIFSPKAVVHTASAVGAGGMALAIYPLAYRAARDTATHVWKYKRLWREINRYAPKHP